MGKDSQYEIALSQVKRLSDAVLPLPPRWLAIVTLVILLSMFEVSRLADGTFTVTFRITSTTALLVALVWLPTLLRVVTLLGGGLKTGAGEATTPGLLALLPKILATLDSVEPNLGQAQQKEVKEIIEEAERQLASTSQDPSRTREQITSLGREYEELRRTMKSGSERTSRLGTLTAQIRALSSQAGYTADEIRSLFNSGSEGGRITALSLLRAKPNPACSDIVISAIRDAKSAYEQYQALRVAEDMLSLLNPDERKQLKDAIEYQRSGAPGTYLMEDTDRRKISDRILKAME